MLVTAPSFLTPAWISCQLPSHPDPWFPKLRDVGQGESPHWAFLQRGDCQPPAATEAARTLGIEPRSRVCLVKAHGKSMRVNSGTIQPDAGRAINKPFNFVFAQRRDCPGCPLQRLRRGTVVSGGRCLRPQSTGNPSPFPRPCPSDRTTRGLGILILEEEKRRGHRAAAPPGSAAARRTRTSPPEPPGRSGHRRRSGARPAGHRPRGRGAAGGIPAPAALQVAAGGGFGSGSAAVSLRPAPAYRRPSPRRGGAAGRVA